VPDLATSLSKFMPLLGSDKVGEVAAAAGMIGKALKREGKDWHDLAKATIAGLEGRPPPQVEERKFGRKDLSERFMLVLTHVNKSRMTEWERSFVQDLADRGPSRLTPRQENKLTSIEVKLGIKRYAWR
jgi:hypothetical protein